MPPQNGRGSVALLLEHFPGADAWRGARLGASRPPRLLRQGGGLGAGVQGAGEGAGGAVV